MAKDTFEEHAADLEKNIGPLGFKTSRATRVDGEDAISVLESEWKTSEGHARLQGRTPVALDRDRILHSDHFRRQDDKYHVLFSGGTRLARTYTSHSIKAAAMARSVASRLDLNSDLAEAVILGSKVGGVPFIHVGKQVLDSWVRDRVKSLDEAQQPPDTSSARTSRPPALFDAEDGENWIFPGWIDGIRSVDLRTKVTRFMPWAAGSSSAGAYASGQESYWTLTVNPFDLEPSGNSYLAQTMYGIWRHSRVSPTSLSSTFRHSLDGLGKSKTKRSIDETHATHEAVLARYCDDITWVLENLNEASRVAALEHQITMHQTLAKSHSRDFDAAVLAALGVSDHSKLYTYFIDDLVTTSKANQSKQAVDVHADETNPLIALSPRASRTLTLMIEFLDSNVFSDERIEFRNRTLKGIISTGLDILYTSYENEMPRRIERAARLDGSYSPDAMKAVGDLLKEPVHRIQASVDLIASMSDREVFELVGLE